jgi:DNA repair protein RecO
MHHIYHTEGIILGSRNFGEASKYYSIFTRDFGRVWASAAGVRKMSSKLRYILQDFTYVKVDLVRGKNFWRITSASKTDALENLLKNKPAFRVFGNIATLLRRLLVESEENQNLFNDFLNGLTVLEKIESKSDLQNIEAIIVLRLLHNLGYIGGGSTLEKIIKSPFEENLIFAAAQSRQEVLGEINKALKETHL